MADRDRERWTKLVADFESCDLTQREFALERGVSFTNLRYWIYRLRKEARPLVEVAPVSSDQAPGRAQKQGGSRLLPVRVVASAPKARESVDGDGHLELSLASGARLRFPVGTDPAYLRALASAL
jgi:hypothetical protein